ncbi:MAG: DUF4434 domain-containing protein [Bacteroidia bacterium]
MKISGTFLDEITHDIPSANWGPAEWARDFDAMQAVGIDTVILIRAGYRDRMTFASKTLQARRPMRPAYDDLVQLFLDQAARCGMTFYFGLYDSGQYWMQGDPGREVEINLAFTEEVVQRYGQHPAFGGWYLSHELSTFDAGTVGLYRRLVEHLRDLRDLPVLMSPYIMGRKQFDRPITPEAHERQWDQVFAQLSGLVDIVAFQDGQVDFLELKEMMEINKTLADRYGFVSWSNVETFERGMPINFLPIAWPNLRYKLEVAAEVGVEKLITFEFSHFLSPHSIYPSAHTLHDRYTAWLQGR